MASSWRATSSFVLITLAMTWPLASGIARDVPGDHGDSLLNMWILGWGAEHLPRVATGQMTLSEFWNANAFHPQPLVLSLSEHLVGQVLQILPVYHLTGNLILCYNLLFLSSFVLSGLGMYLLVRDLTGNAHAAFVAGVIYAFVPIRIAQVAHIQSVSSQWMPFALYGFRRFITTGRYGALAGGAVALLMQNWSCGYYLMFFAPFVPVFVAHQIISHGRWREWRIWAAFTVAAAAVAAGTWPFLMMYLEGQRALATVRELGETISYSADVFSYFTAAPALWLWGERLQIYPKPEGELFFGVTPMLLALVAVAWGGKQLIDRSEPPPANPSRFGGALTIAASILLIVIAAQIVAFVVVLLMGRWVGSFAGIPIRASNPARILGVLSVATAMLLVVSPRARRSTRIAMKSPLGLSILLSALAIWLSLGPLPQSRGRVLQGLGLYGFLYEHVPGFDGLRVAARYSMVAAVFVSIVAGYGVAALLKRFNRPALVAAAISALFLVEVAFVPMPINLIWGSIESALPPKVEPPARAPAVYRALQSMPEVRVVAEFPIGDSAWDLRSMYYSTLHWKRLVNGYSGAFPQRAQVRVARLQQFVNDPGGAWQTLRDAGATHAIVHEAAYPAGQAEGVKQWLVANGARQVGRFESDVLYALP